MKFLITGASGFLGRHLVSVIKDSHSVNTLGRSSEDNIQTDITSPIETLGERYDIVVHSAGKAHVIPKTQEEKNQFHDVNVEGTRNLLSSLEDNLPKWLIFISSVAVYGVDYGSDISENEPLKGDSPYALSKIQGEEIVVSWCRDNGVKYMILRLPLISGTNPPGNLGSLFKAFQQGYYFRIGKGEARRSMVSANSVAELIANGEYEQGIYNLTDGRHPRLNEIDGHLSEILNKKVRSIPESWIRMAAMIGDKISFFPINSYRFNKLVKSLTFNDDLARKQLNWNPINALNDLHP